jgi:uncharacterized protein DUF4136
MPRATHVAVVMLLAVVLSGCATMKVNSHVERGAEFTHYRTWAWASAAAQPTGDPRLDSNPFFEDRLRGAVEHEMTRKGYIRSALAGPPDLLLHYHVNFSKTYEVTGGARSGSCYRNCEPEAYAYEQGTLVVDVVDSRTEKVVWRGWVLDNMEGVIDRQNVMEAEVDAAVAKMFERFPSTLE